MAALAAARPDAAIATACHPIDGVTGAFNPNVVRWCWMPPATRCISAARRFRRPATRSARTRERCRRGCRSHRHYGLYAYPSVLPARVPDARSRAYRKASRRWSSCVRLWHGYRIAVKSRAVRQRPASTRPRTWRACARFSRAAARTKRPALTVLRITARIRPAGASQPGRAAAATNGRLARLHRLHSKPLPCD